MRVFDHDLKSQMALQPVEKVVKESQRTSKHDLLVELLTTVKTLGYQFITVTPRTHQHFLSKANPAGKSLVDIFGWNLPFSKDGGSADAISPVLKKILREATIFEEMGRLSRSKFRISSLGDDLFLHSAFPTEKNDAVFFGPDTYRFCRFIRDTLAKDQSIFLEKNCDKPIRILDIGSGTGAGGIAAVRALPKNCSYELSMNDINANALDLTLVNAQVADVPVELISTNLIEDGVANAFNEKFDLIIANPPYMSDASGRAYRDGGEQLGLDLSIRILKTALELLAPRGKLILYTGVAMTSQSDPFLSTIMSLLAKANCNWSYEEIDPDVFGEELETPLYAKAHRIAAVGLVVTKKM